MNHSDEPRSYHYHAFISYSTRADYSIARELETFLESLHKTPTQNDEPLPQIQICRDGSDFKLSRRGPNAEDNLGDPLWEIIEPELQRSEYLLVLCSPESARSSWVEKEVQWFLKNRGPDCVLLAVTAGEDPVNMPDMIFTPMVREARLHTSKIWYDFRKKQKKSACVIRDYDDERVRLAGDLLGWDATRKGALSASWQRAQRRQMQRILSIVAVAAALLVAIAVFAVWQRVLAMERLRDFHVLTFQSLTMNGQYDLAAQTLEGIAPDDPRLRLADWFARAHHSYPSRISTPLVTGSLRALAFDPRSAILAALNHDNLLVIDPEKEVVMSTTPLPGSASGLVAGDQPSSFYAIGSDSIIRCVFKDERWFFDPMGMPDRVKDIALFHQTDVGIALTDHNAVQVRIRDGIRQENVLFPRSAGLQLVSSLDHSMIGIATKRTSMLGNFRVDENDFHAIFVIRDGEVQAVPLPSKPPVPGHLVGRELFASGLEDDGLKIVRFIDAHEIKTRPIFFKTWVGALVWLPGAIFVQEVGDSTMDVIARLAVLDLSTGKDLVGGSLADEPIWAYAADPLRSRHFFAGQYGRLTTVNIPDTSVRATAFPQRVAGPIRTVKGQLLLRAWSALDRRVWQVDLDLQTMHAIEEYYPTVTNETASGGYLTWQHYPFVFDRSPGGTMIAVGGDRLRIVKLPDRFVGTANVDEDMTSFAQTILMDDSSAVIWDVSIDPPSTIRWISDDLLLAHGFHGDAVLLNLRERSQVEIPIRKDAVKDAVVGVTSRGPLLVSTLSGRVWRIDEQGKPQLFAEIPNLEELFPLDNELHLFVGRSKNPSRTSFFIRRKDKLEEVAAVSSADSLLDATVVGDKLVVLYPHSLRVYPSPLKTLESDSLLGDDPQAALLLPVYDVWRWIRSIAS